MIRRSVSVIQGKACLIYLGVLVAGLGKHQKAILRRCKAKVTLEDRGSKADSSYQDRPFFLFIPAPSSYRLELTN